MKITPARILLGIVSAAAAILPATLPLFPAIIAE